MNLPDIAYWLWLNQTTLLSLKNFHELLKTADPKTAFENKELIASIHPTAKLKKQLLSPDWNEIEESLCWAEQPNQHIICLNDKNYPDLLKQIADPPPVLFVKGDVTLLNQLQIAMVGCRNMSPYGEAAAKYFAEELVSIGIIITSGMALGIDAVCHQTAIQMKGKTIAVLGSGLQNVYPSTHTCLAERISQNGAVLSEFPLNRKASRYQFPRRNRIISGLSKATLIIEAAEKSGSLITAQFALEQNREVFAVPGSVFSSHSKGCHQLIKEGAILARNLEDIIIELDQDLKNCFQNARNNLQAHPKHDKHVDQKRDKLKQFLAYFNDAITSVDQLVKRSNLTVEEVSSMVLILEFEGYIALVPGGFIRTDKER